MRAHVHRSPRPHDAVLAREVLDAEHALVRVLELQDVVRRDLLVLCALLPEAALALIIEGRAELPLPAVAEECERLLVLR